MKVARVTPHALLCPIALLSLLRDTVEDWVLVHGFELLLLLWAGVLLCGLCGRLVRLRHPVCHLWLEWRVVLLGGLHNRCVGRLSVGEGVGGRGGRRRWRWGRGGYNSDDITKVGVGGRGLLSQEAVMTE